MAYKQNNDVNTVIDTLAKNSRGDYIQVSKIESEGGEVSFDIRNMYTNDEDQLCFTSKGIRVKEAMMADIIVGILGNMSEEAYTDIMSRLADGYISKHE